MINKTNAGFSIIEMIVSLALAAFILTATLTMYNQISKTGAIMQKITKTDSQALIMQQRITKDLQGLVPLWFGEDLYKKEKQEKFSNNFLYAHSLDNQFEFLTFVTNNAMQIYGDSPLRTVRVSYVLKKDTQKSKHFKLLRSESKKISEDFDIEKLKQEPFYEIATDITTCTIQYGYPKKTEQGQQLVFVSQWGQKQEKEKNKENEEDKIPDMPSVIKMTIHMAYGSNNQEKIYEFFCSIPTSHAQAPKAFVTMRKEQEKTAVPKAKNSAQSVQPSNDEIKTETSDQPKAQESDEKTLGPINHALPEGAEQHATS